MFRERGLAVTLQGKRETSSLERRTGTIFHQAGIRGAYNTRNRAFYMLSRRFNVIINHSAG